MNNDNKFNHFDTDRFPQMMGMQLKEISLGFAEVTMKITPQMLNFQDVAHGGAIFSLADTAFGLAVNTHGPAVAMQVSINFLRAVKADTMLTATAKEETLTNKTAVYNITVTNDAGEMVALFRGLAFRK